MPSCNCVQQPMQACLEQAIRAQRENEARGPNHKGTKINGAPALARRPNHKHTHYPPRILISEEALQGTVSPATSLRTRCTRHNFMPPMALSSPDSFSSQGYHIMPNQCCYQQWSPPASVSITWENANALSNQPDVAVAHQWGELCTSCCLAAFFWSAFRPKVPKWEPIMRCTKDNVESPRLYHHKYCLV